VHALSEQCFCRVEVARHGKFDFGAGLSKKGRLFFKKNTLIGHRSISFQPVCAKITSPQTVAMEHPSVQKLYSSAIIDLLQIFDLFLAGNRVATIFVTSHMYRIYWELLLIHNSIATLTQLGFSELQLHYQTMYKQVDQLNVLDHYRSQVSGSYDEGTTGMLKVQLHLW